MFRFGSQQKVSGKLDQMLEKPNLTVQQLFSIENIIGDIKQKVEIFVQYCKKHKEFTYKIIQLAMNTSLEQLQEKQLKDIAYVATQFFSCDEDGLGQLFFDSQDQQKQQKKSVNQNKVKNQSEISEKIEQGQPQKQQKTNEQKSQSNINKIQETEQKVIQQTPKKQQKHIFQEFQLIKQTLKILQDPSKNQTCLGYISKLFGFLIRRQSDQPMKFFSSYPQYTKLLFANIKYDSIANLLAQIVACQDRNRVYKYQEYKKQIFTKITDLMIQKIDNQAIFDGIMIFIEQVLNNTKQSYYQYFQDFKRCANVLVSQSILEKVYIKMKESLESSDKQKQNSNKIVFKNSVGYLHMIAKRINAENQDMDYYDQSDKKQPTMNFQTDFLYKNIDTSVKLIEKINSQGLIAKNVFLSFIIQLMKNQKFKDFPYDFISDISIQLKCLKQWKHTGIIKNSLFQIIDLSILRTEPEKIINLFEKHPQVINQYFLDLSEALQKSKSQLTNIQVQNKKINLLRENNKKQNICYFYKTLFLLKSKDHQNISKKLNDLGIKIDNMEFKYATTLAGPNNSLKESIQFKNFSKDDADLKQINNATKEQQKVFQSSSNADQIDRQYEKQKEIEVIAQSPIVFDLSDNNASSFSQFVNKSHNIFIPTLNIPHHGTSSTKENSNLLQNQKKQSDIIIDLDTEGAIIEQEQLQLLINSPKRPKLIDFMGASSPRGLNFSGSGFKSDRSSQGKNSARSKQVAQENSSKENIQKGNQKDEKDKPNHQKQEKLKKISPEEVIFFIRHDILF